MSSIQLSYGLIFSRISIGLIFALSGFNKLRDFSSFRRAVLNFKVIPDRFVSLSSYLFLTGELIVVGLIAVGGSLLPFGFGLALLLLSAFSVAVISVLARKLQTPCNCFGRSDQAVSRYEVLRNLAFAGISLFGLSASTSLVAVGINLSIFEVSLLGIMAAMFVTLFIYGREIVEVVLET